VTEASVLTLTEQTILEPDEEWDLRQNDVEQIDDDDDEEEEEEDDEDDGEGEEEGAEDVDEGEGEGPDEEGAIEEAAMDVDPPFDMTGLKEIGNLASWTVSTYKPGCGIEALRDEDTNLFWQSDGPQPHRLNIHFVRLVEIRAIRLFLDFEADESYTPTRITLLAGTGYHDLIEFSTLEFVQPKGWINVPLQGVGGGTDGNTLRAFLVQVKVVENHQNGKDTHLRGLKIYAKDDKAEKGGLDRVDDALGKVDKMWSGTRDRWKKDAPAAEALSEPDWMGEAELR